ncbi:Putative C4-dicarboxylate transport system (plasmid) [Sodalis praecaptivus]|uniref:TRAP transporter small permease protein n=1 Tax=Sodalis praecaptivus TaxID=1239307 RepID=W0HZP9_9GAMM|nr:TRAP transporter small permease subunit [Sodalis praecaptivus]AHF79244.1 Putative C4-dicarboxylate transport system [Sodalis praecaptivus]
MSEVNNLAVSGPRIVLAALKVMGLVLFLITLGSTLLGIVARYFGWTGLEWTFETAEIAFIWVTFIGAVLAEMRGENVRFTSAVALLPAKARHWLQLVTMLVLLAICLWLLTSGIAVWRSSAWVPTPVLRLPNGIITLSLLSFAVLLSFLSLWRIGFFFFSRAGAGK